MTDPRFLQVVKAFIAVKGIQKKVLARRCKVSRSYFSLMLSGDKRMPEAVKTRLISELGLESYLGQLGL